MGIVDRIGNAIDEYKTEPFDPAVFDDDVALETDWEPLQQGGTGNTTFSLKKISLDRVEFRAHGNVRITSTLFILLGIGLGGTMLTDLINVDSSTYYAVLFFGAIFILIGLSRLNRLQKPRVFDLDKGFFWIGKKAPDTNDSNNSNVHCSLNDIHAIQLLHERCNSAGNSGADYFYSYELNLVLQDGQRINVVDHGSLSRIREDAKALAHFLDVQVWDAIPDHCY